MNRLSSRAAAFALTAAMAMPGTALAQRPTAPGARGASAAAAAGAAQPLKEITQDIVKEFGGLETAVKTLKPGGNYIVVIGSPAAANIVNGSASAAKIPVFYVDPAVVGGAQAQPVLAFGANGTVEKFALPEAANAVTSLQKNGGVAVPAQQAQQTAVPARGSVAAITAPTVMVVPSFVNEALANAVKAQSQGQSTPLSDLRAAQTQSSQAVAAATNALYDFSAVTGNNEQAYAAMRKGVEANQKIMAVGRMTDSVTRLKNSVGNLPGVGGLRRGIDKDAALFFIDRQATQTAGSGNKIVIVTFEDSRNNKQNDITAAELQQALQTQGQKTQLPRNITILQFESQASTNREAKGLLEDKAEDGIFALYNANGFITALNREQLTNGDMEKILQVQALVQPRTAQRLDQGNAPVALAGNTAVGMSFEELFDLGSVKTGWSKEDGVTLDF